MTRILVIIDAEHLPSARALLEMEPFLQTPEQAAASFVRADQGGTRYWLSAQVSDTALAACQQLAAALPWAECHEYDLDTQPGFPAEWLTQNHLQPYTPDTP
jgi:hypothetical protein